MIALQELYRYIQGLAPLELAESWDNPGLLVDCCRPVSRVLTCLDITAAVVEEAQEKGCELILSHHPVIFSPLKTLQAAQVPCCLLKAGISAICMHTNLDAAPGGVNDTLAGLLGLQAPQPFAGGMGRVGQIEQTTAGDLAQRAARLLDTHIKWADSGRPIHCLAVISGSGGSLLPEAIAAGADALFTGEAGHHAAHDALSAGVSLIAAGHYATEFPVAAVLSRRLKERFSSIEVFVSERDKDPFQYL